MEEGAGKRCSECDQYSNLSEGADRVGGQLRGDKECPFSGVTKSGRVWRKVPESDDRSVVLLLSGASRDMGLQTNSCTRRAMGEQHLQGGCFLGRHRVSHRQVFRAIV